VTELRHRYGIPVNARRVALIVAGSWGVGDVHRTARELVESGAALPVVVCGRNERLRSRLAREGLGVALGWVEDMAGLMRACDVLIQNAGGLTCLEAFAVGLPVISYRCLAGHGRTNAEAMAEAGVAPYVHEPRCLSPTLDRLDPLTRRRAAALFTVDPTELIDTWMAQPDGYRPPAPRPVRATLRIAVAAALAVITFAVATLTMAVPQRDTTRLDTFIHSVIHRVVAHTGGAKPKPRRAHHAGGVDVPRPGFDPGASDGGSPVTVWRVPR
jgi:hypothetical protein